MKASLFALVTASAFLTVRCAPAAQNDAPYDDEFGALDHYLKLLTRSTTQAPTRTTPPSSEPTTLIMTTTAATGFASDRYDDHHGAHDDDLHTVRRRATDRDLADRPTRADKPGDNDNDHDPFDDDEDFIIFPPRENHPYNNPSSSSSLPEPTTLVPRATSWAICDGTNPDNPYTTPNGKKFYYNCNWRYELLDVNGWHQWFKTTSFRACIDSCSTSDKCNAIWFFKSDSECWLLDAARKQKASELTYNDVSHGIDSAILL